MKLGVFDSGLGGTTVVRRLRERLPQADILFFADQRHAPYGERDPQELHGILESNLKLLEERGVDAIVMGCNTSCAIANQFGGMPKLSIPVFDLIKAGAKAGFVTSAPVVGVVATTATVRSGAYTRMIHLHDPSLRVVEVAAPKLVPMIEGNAGDAEIAGEVGRVCGQLGDVQALVLGCSHYPLISSHFVHAMAGTVIIDPALTQAEEVLIYARNLGKHREGNATLEAWTNADTEQFDARLEALNLRSGNSAAAV